MLKGAAHGHQGIGVAKVIIIDGGDIHTGFFAKLGKGSCIAWKDGTIGKTTDEKKRGV